MDSVKYFLQSAFRAAIITPLTTGNSVNRNNPTDTDGSLASMVTTACLTAITFVIIGIYGGKQRTDMEAHYVIWALVMFMIVLALCCVIVISVVAYRKRSEWLPPETLISDGGSLRLKIMFLWLFGFGIILETTISLAINIDCIRNDVPNKITYRVLSIASNVLALVYYCLQMGFISYFINYRFEGFIRINYGILTILLANLIHWFVSIISEANHTYFNKDKDDANYNGMSFYDEKGNFIPLQNATDGDCYWTSKIQYFLQTLLPYLLPARIEYFLLATGCILSMWPSVNQEEISTEETGNELNSIRYSSESTPLLESISTSRFSLNSSTTNHQSTQRRGNPVSFFLTIIFGIAMNLPLIVCDFVLVFIPSNPGDDNVFISWEVIVCIYKFIMLFMTITIFIHLSRKAESHPNPKKLSANEYILIFSAAGSVAFLTFGIIAGIQIRTYRGNLVLADCLIDILTIYAQTVLIIHSERKIPGNYVRTCCATEHLILLLAVCNFIVWAVDSFIDNEYKKDMHIESEFFGKVIWERVHQILVPLLIFYRFHASIDLYGLFCRFRRMR